MAAKIVDESRSLESIFDVSGIYEIYFSSIKRDIESLNNRNLLVSAGIVSFFRIVDKNDHKVMTLLSAHFNLSPEDFWESCLQLNAIEIMDIHEGEIVKISDQVMATYLFYLCFFAEEHLDFKVLITALFPEYKRRLVDALNPVLNSFDYKGIKKIILPHIEEVWESQLTSGRSKAQHFIDIFWFLKPSETLIYMQQQVLELSPTPYEQTRLKIETDQSDLPDYLSVLPHFKHFSDDYFGISLDILFLYVEKAPEDAGKVIYLLTHELGFEPDSYEFDYRGQKKVIEKVTSKSRSGDNELVTKLFFALAGEYLNTQYSSTRGGRNHTISICEFGLTDTPALRELRSSVLNHAIKLSRRPQFEGDFYGFLQGLADVWPTQKADSIIEYDAGILLPHFTSYFTPENLLHCILVNQYCAMLKRLKIPFSEAVKLKFKTPQFQLYDAMFIENDRADMRLGYKKYAEYKSKKIKKLCARFDLQEYQAFILQLETVFIHSLDDRKHERLSQSLKPVIEQLSEQSPHTTSDVFRTLVKKESALRINPINVIGAIYKAIGKSQLWTLLNEGDIENKRGWLFAFYISLQPEEVCIDDVNAVKKLYSHASSGFYNNLQYLLKFEAVEQGLVHFVVSTLVGRAINEPEIAVHVTPIFHDYADEDRDLFRLVMRDQELLQKCYILADGNERLFDFTGKFMSRILNKDKHFLRRFLKGSKTQSTFVNDRRDYSFIWLREDYQELMDEVSQFYQTGDHHHRTWREYKSFYKKGAHPQKDANIIEKQDSYILALVTKFSSNKEYMSMLFDVISEFDETRKLKFVAAFLGTNQDMNDFKNIRFWPSIRTYSGSRIPYIRAEIRFLESVSALCDTVELLPHKSYIEEAIRSKEFDILSARKHEFKDDF